MGVSDFNLKGEHKKNIGLFTSMVNLALADDVLSEGEDKLLKKVAKKFHILDDKYKEILEDQTNHQITGVHGYDERIEHLFDLTNMIYADDVVSIKEVGILRRICVGLGFPIDNVEKVADEAIHLILNDDDLEEFTKAIKRVNKF